MLCGCVSNMCMCLRARLIKVCVYIYIHKSLAPPNLQEHQMSTIYWRLKEPPFLKKRSYHLVCINVSLFCDVNMLSAAHWAAEIWQLQSTLGFPSSQAVRLKEPQMRQSWAARKMYIRKPHSDLRHQFSMAGCTFQKRSYTYIFLEKQKHMEIGGENLSQKRPCSKNTKKLSWLSYL